MEARSSDGFYTSHNSLQFPNGVKLYSNIEGVSINESTGQINLVLTEADSELALFSQNDVDLVTKNGIIDATFSLDPAVRDLRI